MMGITGKVLNAQDVRKFRAVICGYYRREGRDLPWRNTDDPYRILVSEIMLQQTQVERVVGKYERFIRTFPGFPSLAAAPLRKILAVWQGLGYNRRALALQGIARTVVTEYKGMLPSSVDALATFPGIGRATASAIAAFAFNEPTVFIETNIRRVFLHFFFGEREGIRDAEILPLVERTLDRANPRAWYNALMDYGVMLKKQDRNPNRRSAHYQRQAPFKGSNRQLRGMILKAVLAHPRISLKEMAEKLGRDSEQVEEALLDLESEGFVKKRGKRYSIM